MYIVGSKATWRTEMLRTSTKVCSYSAVLLNLDVNRRDIFAQRSELVFICSNVLLRLPLLVLFPLEHYHTSVAIQLYPKPALTSNQLNLLNLTLIRLTLNHSCLLH